MLTKEIRIQIYEFNHIDELSAIDKKLILNARDVSKKAYTPYSGFHVGAALLLTNGEIITGNNQENSAFTTGMCAERVALSYANANFPDTPVISMAISASNKEGIISKPVFPCGACRQSLIETELRFKTPIKLIFDSIKKIQMVKNAGSLLPLHFDEAYLK